MYRRPFVAARDRRPARRTATATADRPRKRRRAPRPDGQCRLESLSGRRTSAERTSAVIRTRPYDSEVVSATTEELVDRGMAAFSSGDMSTAHEVMSKAVEEADAPLARLILGGLAYAREDYPETQEHWEAAFRSYKDADDPRGAAL